MGNDELRETVAETIVEEWKNTIPAPATAAIALSADSVAREQDKLVEDGRMSANDKGLVLWFFGHAKERGLSLAEAGKEIHYNAATVSRLFRGNYEGRVENIIRNIRAYKQIVDERAKMTSDEFIETSIWKDIRKTCDLSLLRHAPARIIGVSQIGKTYALKEYQRRSEYLVRYARIPAAPSLRGVIEAIAGACAVTQRQGMDDMRRRVVGALDHNTLLIIDELHELAISAGPTVAMRAMEWIREIYDLSGCGLVVCGTRTMEDDLIKRNAWLDQFDQRCIKKLTLPTRLPDADILLCAKTYGFPEPDSRTMDILRSLRMNRLCTSLNLTSDVANRRGGIRTWELFRDTCKATFGEL